MEILNKTIEQVRKQYGVAGGILIAIKDGKVLLKECFGQADAEKGKPVDSKTLFQIASCSKAFTTMVAGQLCDEGKMTWDTPVKQLMPDFKMVDKYAEEHVTPRDMACHRTGLCRHDVMRTFVREDSRPGSPHRLLPTGIRLQREVQLPEPDVCSTGLPV